MRAKTSRLRPQAANSPTCWQDRRWLYSRLRCSRPLSPAYAQSALDAGSKWLLALLRHADRHRRSMPETSPRFMSRSTQAALPKSLLFAKAQLTEKAHYRSRTAAAVALYSAASLGHHRRQKLASDLTRKNARQSYVFIEYDRKIIHSEYLSTTERGSPTEHRCRGGRPAQQEIQVRARSEPAVSPLPAVGGP